ncbi:MAG: hypothetical protein DHS20C13_06670 [Thermodesulfobacteriota bacterium]|nr:MAG: hypothetical protein DHS20C13_06670 [Thermodesulfobacteriota bacterium]
MKKVLVIGCDFSPSSLPNALRLRFLVSHLVDFGWEPTILTTNTDYSLYPVDKENSNLLPEKLNIIRSKAIPLNYTKYFGLNDIGMRSLWHYWNIISEHCSKGLVDLIIISVPPHLPMILGRLAKKKFGIPYVIDYQDPWVSDYFMKLPISKRSSKAYLAYGLSKLLEPSALREASGIIGVSQGTTDDVLNRYNWSSNLKTAEIPLGIEPQDFEYLKRNPRKNSFYNKNEEYFNVCYIGVYAASMEHTVRALFKAFKLGLDENHNLFSQIRFKFIGTSYYTGTQLNYQITPIAEEYGISEYVYEQPERVSYLDAIQLMHDSHTLLALGSEEPHYTASKIFPYILAKKHILAIFHEDSSVVDILNNTSSGKAITFNSQDFPNLNTKEIKNKLTEVASLSRDYSPSTNWEKFELFTAKAMSQKLAEFLDDVYKN